MLAPFSDVTPQNTLKNNEMETQPLSNTYS